MSATVSHRILACPEELDLQGSQRALRLGPQDPSMRLRPEVGEVWRGTRTPNGIATYCLARVSARELRVRAWGAGADWVLEHSGALAGLKDEPHQYRPAHALLRRAARRFPGIYMPQTRRVFEGLVPIVLQQLVTWREARRALLGLYREYGDSAPHELRVLPSPARLRELGLTCLVAVGALPRQARTLSEIALVAGRLERLIELDPVEAGRRMMSVRGIGPWTAAGIRTRAFGDPDAVLVGDYHLPREVCWALTGEEGGDDRRMLQLLEPERGHRARAVQLLHMLGRRPPRRGPRRPMRTPLIGRLR